MPKKSYLTDFHRSADGNFVYSGKVYKTANTAEEFRHLCIKETVFSALALIFVIGQGFVHFNGANGCFYVLLPYIGQISALLAVGFGVAKTVFRAEMREYIYTRSFLQLPARFTALSAMCGLSVICTCVFGALNSFDAGAFAWMAFSASGGVFSALALRSVKKISYC